MTILFKAEMRRVLLDEECPLCVLRGEDEVRNLYGLLHEGLSNAPYLERLSRAGGFCRDHAWALQRLEERDWHDGLTNASFERPLLAEAIEQIERLPMTAKAVRRARQDRTLAPCPACQARAQMEQIRAATFAEAMQDPELAGLSAQRKLGLCMPHFRLVWNQKMPDETRRFLAETQRRQLRGLLVELDQYLRKHHWHVKEIPLPEEAESWRRAVAMLSGQAPDDALGDLLGCASAIDEQTHGHQVSREQQADTHSQETSCRRSSM